MLKYILSSICIFTAILFYPLDIFKGYDDNDSANNYSLLSLLESKYTNDSKWNENYFHDAIFPENGITIFTNIIFSNSFISKKGCKFHCIITFNDGTKYVFNKDYKENEYTTSKNKFLMTFDENKIELIDNNYYLKLKDDNINLTLKYEIKNPPHRFGSGIINIDSNNFLAFSQPIAGADVIGSIVYKDKSITLSGKGSLNHDYSVTAPLKNPLKWRSFWLYNDNYTILINTIILKDNTQVDRVIIYREGKILKSILNAGLKSYNYTIDKKNAFNYPQNFLINYSDKNGDNIIAQISFKEFTDKIQAFSHLSSFVHTVVSNTVGEMWVYRFWADASFKIKIGTLNETINISGIGNYVDVDK